MQEKWSSATVLARSTLKGWVVKEKEIRDYNAITRDDNELQSEFNTDGLYLITHFVQNWTG